MTGMSPELTFSTRCGEWLVEPETGVVPRVRLAVKA